MQIGRLDFFQAIYLKGALLNGSEIKLLSLTLLFTTNEGTIIPKVGSTKFHFDIILSGHFKRRNFKFYYTDIHSFLGGKQRRKWNYVVNF